MFGPYRIPAFVGSITAGLWLLLTLTNANTVTQYGIGAFYSIGGLFLTLCSIGVVYACERESDGLGAAALFSSMLMSLIGFCIWHQVGIVSLIAVIALAAVAVPLWPAMSQVSKGARLLTWARGFAVFSILPLATLFASSLLGKTSIWIPGLMVGLAVIACFTFTRDHSVTVLTDEQADDMVLAGPHGD